MVNWGTSEWTSNMILEQWFLTFLKTGNTFDYMKNFILILERNTKINDPKKKKYIPLGNKYILEDILLNIFKFYILKYYKNK